MLEYIKKILGSGTASLTVSSNERENIKKFKSLEDSGLLLKGIRETIENEAKSKKENLLVCYWVHEMQFY